jgi:8-oxo-dGTP pyrophosphatase MutT (NUDIX family)
MKRTENVILTNMVMVYDDAGNVLVEDRVDPGWRGVAFPGGHVEKGEPFVDAAIREVYEETGVQIRIYSDFRETVRYHPMPGVSKEVAYFLTETNRSEIRPRPGEIAQVEWVPLEQAEASLTHENDKTVLRAAIKRIESGEALRPV